MFRSTYRNRVSIAGSIVSLRINTFSMQLRRRLRLQTRPLPASQRRAVRGHLHPAVPARLVEHACFVVEHRGGKLALLNM